MNATPACAAAPLGTRGRAPRRRRLGACRAASLLTAGLALLCCLAAAVLHLLFGVSAHVVLTGSMRPTFAPGDVVFTVSRPVASLRVGQVPLIVPPAGTAAVAHRLVAITHDRNGHAVLHTAGDSNSAPDPWSAVPTSPRVPVVIGSVPKLGYLTAAVRGVFVRCALIVVLGVVVTWATVRRALRRSGSPAAERRAPVEPRAVARRPMPSLVPQRRPQPRPRPSPHARLAA